MILKVIGVLFLSISVGWTAERPNNCEMKKGVLEIGSGSTKIYASVVDVCLQKVKSVLLEKRVAMPFNEHLERSKAGILEEAALTEGVQKIQPLFQELKDLKLDQTEAIATSAFRVAKNGKSFAKRLSDKLGIQVQVISQKQEAILGYLSVVSRTGNSSDDILVWDIGGGSMQMIRRNDKSDFDFYEGSMASVPFKNEVLRKIKKVDQTQVFSPNPISPYEKETIALAQSLTQTVPSWVLKKGPQSQWIGIGGVLSGSVQKQSAKDKNEITLSELEKAFYDGAKKSDSEIQSDYRITDISNMALVLGFMKSLKISKIQTLNISLGEGQVLFSNPPAASTQK